jgi:DNA topoisomerase-2
MNSKPKESNNEDMGNGGPPPAKKPAKNKKIEEIYQKKTQLEHILLRPDTYIGTSAI